MRFDIHLPCDALKPYIRHLAISEAEEEGQYKILPDTGVVIGFQYCGRLSYVTAGSETPLSTAGINDSYRVFHNSPKVGSILVFFAEGGAAAFFRQPIDDCFARASRWITLCCAPNYCYSRNKYRRQNPIRTVSVCGALPSVTHDPDGARSVSAGSTGYDPPYQRHYQDHRDGIGSICESKYTGAPLPKHHRDYTQEVCLYRAAEAGFGPLQTSGIAHSSGI